MIVGDMMDEKNNNYFQLLAIGQFVFALLLIIGVITIGFYQDFVFSYIPDDADIPNSLIDNLMPIIFHCWTVLFAVLAVLAVLAGFSLRRRKNRVFCIIVGFLECLLPPIGLVLGVFTLIMLYKE